MKNLCNIFLTVLPIVIFANMLPGCAPAKVYPPILVLATDDHFGSFAAEILKTEGYNAFRMEPPEPENMRPDFLKKFDIVILGQASISDTQKESLEQYVDRGGNLIVFRPDKKLGGILGITPTGGTLSQGYITIDTASEAGKGLLSQPLPFYGEADGYALQGAASVAALYADTGESSGLPAVILHQYGKGACLAFLYNLPQSIVYSRQGNPAHAGKEMDGILGLRAMDLFTGGWVKPEKNTLNHADEQMRLLSNGIALLSRKTRPIPRLWYFPDTLKCLVTLNNDGEDSKEEAFEPQFADVHAKGAKMTLYIKETDLVTREWVNKWTDRGFEISGHPDDTRQAENPDWNTMDSVYKDLQNKLRLQYGISAMHTVVNHWFVWPGKLAGGEPDFAAQARIEENNGIRLDCNYAHYDNGSTHGAFLGDRGLNQGNYNGSGLVMKYADAKGKPVNVYQQLNNVYDQQYMEHQDQDGFFNAFRGLVDRSLENGIYSFVCVKAHNNEYFFSKIPLMKMLDYANARDIPVWTELKLLQFLQARDETAFKNLTWKNNRLSFEIHSTLPHDNGITFMIPNVFDNKQIQKIYLNGASHPVAITAVKGVEYAWLSIKPGTSHQVEIDFDN